MPGGADNFRLQAHLREIRVTGQEMMLSRTYKDGDESKGDLIAIAAIVQEVCGGQIGVIIPQELKGQLRAREKAAWDEDSEGERKGGPKKADFLTLKDIVRITLIAPSQAALIEVRSQIASYCVAKNGYKTIKNKLIPPPGDVCGYSGLNMVITLHNGQSAEIQGNTPEVIFAKVGPRASCEKFIGPSKYSQIEKKYQLHGGLGHNLYKIFRSKGGIEIKETSRKYYNYFRSPMPSRSDRSKLQTKLNKIIRENPTYFSRTSLHASQGPWNRTTR